ncbi:hypothetical protein CYMTET_56912 [Cymbomonas tetramitiformis]|uniref:Uncharacterized protein n=1 Tax=Cymbomonas tetramitiformis TaxID=36881 RepID=A0AAE0ELH9_9CHLO|nr:hypothetical protein CYMTET_56912 [Cymbomonas tetramitiformis]
MDANMLSTQRCASMVPLMTRSRGKAATQRRGAAVRLAGRIAQRSIKKNTQAAQEASFRKQLTTESKQGNRSKNAKKRSRSAVRNKPRLHNTPKVYRDTSYATSPCRHMWSANL